MIMKKNMGSADRIVRILIALLATYLYYAGIVTGTWGIMLIVVSVIFVLTSAVGFCPLYAVFGIRTCPVKKA